jgi:hypothetical protein
MDLDIIKRRRPCPNLALMKLSAYHKANGDDVFLNFPLCQPDKVYASCVFTWNGEKKRQILDGATIGGSGIDFESELPPEVEHIMPDYGLYPNIAPPWRETSMGFTSRGCIRKCPFCFVPQKEGGIRAVARIYEFWNRKHRKIMLLDNNLLASPHWRQTMEDLIAEELEVDFNQGLDIRLLNEENLDYLKRVRAKELRFAFDDIAYEKAVEKGIKLLLSGGLGSRRLSFYFLYGFPAIEQECIERAKILASYNVDVYPMAYKGLDGKEPQRVMLENLEDIPLLHGSRHNINKFLRLVGRLP